MQLDEKMYSFDQLAELKLGQQQNIDTSLYENPDYLAIQMRQIRLGLESGVDVSLYADPAFDWFQMTEIRTGLEMKLDVSQYADSKISYRTMRQIRLALQDNMDLSEYLMYPAAVIEQIRLGLLKGYDISSYVRQGVSTELLQQVRISLEHHISLGDYIYMDFRGASLAEIRIGLEEGLDVSIYADPIYSWRQMREIRLGLENRVDIEKYRNPLYTYMQMREIRLGLEAGIDVDEYRRMRFSATDMHEKRLKLIENITRAENITAASFTDIRNIIAAIPESKDPYELVVSEDGMEVYLVIKDREKEITEEQILKSLWDRKVRKGILRREIKKALDGTYEEDTVLVACGMASRSGKDGWYEFFFRTDVNGSPTILEDGSADFSQLDWYDEVEAGAEVARYHAAEAGVDGYNVYGEVLSAKKGVEARVLSGYGFSLSADHTIYTAEGSGLVRLVDGNRLEITPVLVLDEVSLASGDVEFAKDIHIRKNVGRGVTIRCGGNVVVDGFVEGATIIAEGDILLKNGMNGSGIGKLEAKGSITGKFLEGVEAHSGSLIRLNYAMSSTLESDDAIEMLQSNAALVGGSAVAENRITVQNVGNKYSTKTSLQVGIGEKLLEQAKENAKDIKGVKDELRLLENAKQEIDQKFDAEQRAHMEIYTTLGNAIYTKDLQLKELSEKKDALAARIERMNDSYIEIVGQLYEGVKLDVNGKGMDSFMERGITIRRIRYEGVDKLIIDKN